jgi:hypothetical protein
VKYKIWKGQKMPRTLYKNSLGKRLVGTTTITGSELGWNKGVLIDWANKKGLDGIDTRDYVDELAEIGTIAHDLVTCKVTGKIMDRTVYPEEKIKRAENCLDSYNNWSQGKNIKPILSEVSLVSEKYQYGGTPDFYGMVDGMLTLVDYKTGKGIYDEYLIQVAGGYRILLEENGHKVDRIQILNIPRSAGESFQILTVDKMLWEYCGKIFLNCLENYRLHKRLKGE